MKKFIKFKGDKDLEGSYEKKGLTIGKYYEIKGELISVNLITVINDKEIEATYSMSLFE